MVGDFLTHSVSSEVMTFHWFIFSTLMARAGMVVWYVILVLGVAESVSFGSERNPVSHLGPCSPERLFTCPCYCTKAVRYQHLFLYKHQLPGTKDFLCVLARLHVPLTQGTLSAPTINSK